VRHAHDPYVGQDPRAEAQRARQEHLRGVLLGVEGAAELTEAGPLAAEPVVGERAAAPAEPGDAARQQRVVAVAAVGLDQADRELLLHAGVRGLEIARPGARHRVVASPLLEQRGGGAPAEAGVVHGAPPDVASAEHPNREVLGRAPPRSW
jgi:hypothetical protein